VVTVAQEKPESIDVKSADYEYPIKACDV